MYTVINTSELDHSVEDVFKYGRLADPWENKGDVFSIAPQCDVIEEGKSVKVNLDLSGIKVGPINLKGQELDFTADVVKCVENQRVELYGEHSFGWTSLAFDLTPRAKKPGAVILASLQGGVQNKLIPFFYTGKVEKKLEAYLQEPVDLYAEILVGKVGKIISKETAAVS
jgi:hypothetical protein